MITTDAPHATATAAAAAASPGARPPVCAGVAELEPRARLFVGPSVRRDDGVWVAVAEDGAAWLDPGLGLPVDVGPGVALDGADELGLGLAVCRRVGITVDDPPALWEGARVGCAVGDGGGLVAAADGASVESRTKRRCNTPNLGV